MSPRIATRIAIASLIAVASFTGLENSVVAQHRIGDLCHVKGQEVNMLRGVGLVVGLAGTGDPTLSTTRQALATALVNSGLELPVDAFGREDASELQGVTNVAIVFVTARVPAVGARNGSLIDCQVQAFGNAKSLAGGFLVSAAMTGGPAQDGSGNLPVFATARGRVNVEPSDVSTTGSITNGCQMIADFENSFYYMEEPAFNEYGMPIPPGTAEPEMFIDLIIKDSQATFGTAAGIVYGINARLELFGERAARDGAPELLAIAKDQRTVKVKVPKFQESDPVSFVSDVLEITLFDIAGPAIVVINEKTGSIIVGENVLFSPVAISNGSFSIEPSTFTALSLQDNQPIEGGQRRQLDDLVNALNNLQAPSDTIIDIIKQLDRGGYLYGRIVLAE